MRIRKLLVLAAAAVTALTAAAFTHRYATSRPPTSQRTHTGPYADADSYVHERMEATRTPGLAYAIVDSKRTVHRRAWGHDGDGRPVDDHTPFLWGSVSKPVTATAVMSLVEKGVLDLDSRVADHLPWFALTQNEGSDQITVRHLLHQTSGIPNNTGTTDRFTRVDDPYRSAVADLATASPVAAPGERHAYTSANYLILGALVEAVTGQTYDTYLRSAVLDPLEMTNTITTPAEARSHLPKGHRYLAGRPMAMTTPFDPTGPSYGYLGGTVQDLARFAIAHLGDGSFGGSEVVSPASLEAMHRGVATVSDDTAYGMGWRDTVRDGLHMVWHAGASPGYQAIIVLLPELDRGVVMLQNAYGHFQDAELAAAGLNTARIVAGGEPRPVGTASGYALILSGLVLALSALLAAVARAAFRITRPTLASPTRARTAAALWIGAGTGIAVVPEILLRRGFGVGLRELYLFIPDIGWGLRAATVLGVLLIPLHAALAVLRSRSPSGQR